MTHETTVLVSATSMALRCRPFALLLFVATACSAPQPRVGLLPDLRYPGFRTFPTPRTHDAPGTVFRVGPDGTTQLVTRLDVPVEQGSEAFPSYELRSYFSATALANILGRTSLSTHFGTNQLYEATVCLGAGHTERTYDTDIDSAVREARFDIISGWDYFVVRETISVASVEFAFEKTISDFANLRTALKSVAEAEAGITWESKESDKLKKNFEVPHRVFYKSSRVVLSEGQRTVAPVFRGDLTKDEYSKFFQILQVTGTIIPDIDIDYRKSFIIRDDNGTMLDRIFYDPQWTIGQPNPLFSEERSYSEPHPMFNTTLDPPLVVERGRTYWLELGLEADAMPHVRGRVQLHTTRGVICVDIATQFGITKRGIESLVAISAIGEERLAVVSAPGR